MCQISHVESRSANDPLLVGLAVQPVVRSAHVHPGRVEVQQSVHGRQSVKQRIRHGMVKLILQRSQQPYKQ